MLSQSCAKQMCNSATWVSEPCCTVYTLYNTTLCISIIRKDHSFHTLLAVSHGCAQGGVDHGFPVLVSEIYEGLPAARCGGLVVGDAILAVNGVDLRGATHAQAVHALTEAVRICSVIFLLRYLWHQLCLLWLHNIGANRESIKQSIVDGHTLCGLTFRVRALGDLAKIYSYLAYL